MASASPMLAFDLGGTRIKAGAVTLDGEVPAVLRVPVKGTLEAVLADLQRLGERLRPRGGWSSVGLAVPGIVENGRVRALPGKLDGIVGLDLRAELARRFGAPAQVWNDALAYGAGEAVFGAGRDADRVVVMTAGTGVGTTVYEDGRPLGAGALGGGVLGGQMPIAERPGGALDTSGRSGTIEALCRVAAIVETARLEGLEGSTVEEVYRAARAGEKAALRALDRYRLDLARAVAALALAHAPDVVVLGGGPFKRGNPATRGIEALVQPQMFGDYRVRVRLAALGDAAALAGLAALSR